MARVRWPRMSARTVSGTPSAASRVFVEWRSSWNFILTVIGAARGACCSWGNVDALHPDATRGACHHVLRTDGTCGCSPRRSQRPGPSAVNTVPDLTALPAGLASRARRGPTVEHQRAVARFLPAADSL